MLASIVCAALQETEARDVAFRFSAPRGSQSVAVVGQFNEWDRARHPLREEDGVWATTVKIAPGVYQYLFVIDGKRWVRDPAAPTALDANGNTNSLLVVEPEDYSRAPAVPGDGIVTLSAVRHRPDRRDTVRKNRTEALLRVRVRKGDVAAVEVVPVGAQPTSLHLSRSDELFDYWQGVVSVPPGPFEYRFRLDGQTVVGDGDTGDDAKPFRQSPRDMHLPKIPDWLETAVFYQVFPDRFENGSAANDAVGTDPWGSAPSPTNWLGGDLEGVRKRLSHIEGLGVTGLYLNPVFKTQSNHGYTTDDYYEIDPRFGSQAELAGLVEDCRARGIRVVLDGVFNHSGTGYAPFRSVAEHGEASPYAGFFHVLRFPLEVREGQQTYGTFAGVWQMPKLATHTKAVQAEVAKIGTHWIREAGIGGWRLDVADEVDPECWRVFRKAVKRADPDSYILGEVWGDAREWLQGDMFDGVMNYRWRDAVLGLVTGRLKPSEFATSLKTIEEDYPDGASKGLVNLLGSHDTERLRRIVPSRDLRMAAVAIQFTWPGVPCVYYGDEVGLDGGRDPDCRRCMEWDSAKWDGTMLEHYRSLAKLRKSRAALQSGAVRMMATDDGTGLVAYRRDSGKDKVWTVVNVGKRAVTHFLGSGRWQTVVGRGQVSDGEVTVPARGCAVLVEAG